MTLAKQTVALHLAMMKPFVKLLSARLRSYFASQAGLVLDNLSGLLDIPQPIETSIQSALLPDWGVENERYQRFMGSVYQDVAGVWGQSVIDDFSNGVSEQRAHDAFWDFCSEMPLDYIITYIGIPWSVDKDAFEVARPVFTLELEDRLRVVGSRINSTTKLRLVTKLSKVITLGAGIDELADAIMEAYDGTSMETPRRSNAIARTEATGLAGLGSVAGARQSGVIARKQWVTVGESSRHQWADGEEVMLEEQFMLTGEPLRYPADTLGSPGNIINCRCFLKFNRLA